MNLDRFSEELSRLVARCGAPPNGIAQVLRAKAEALDPDAWDGPAQIVDYTGFSLVQETSEPEPAPRPKRFPWGPDPLPQADALELEPCEPEQPFGFAGDVLPQA